MDMRDMQPDVDPQETREWLEALDSVLEREGPARANYLLEKLVEKARQSGAYIPYNANTAYLNTIPLSQEERSPGDAELEHKLRSLVRWNAMAMVVRANKESSELGGHIASFASAATLYDVGFNHFFRAANDSFGGDLVYFQGHSAPGIYARAYLEGRISEEQMNNFRQEVGGKGLSSYPHPVAHAGLLAVSDRIHGAGSDHGDLPGALHALPEGPRHLAPDGRKVWAFMGDGEMDEPESLGAISLAAREKLDNLIFVVNCNLQRLDGPVRGNGKIIQELEAEFRGAGWNVIKVIWGSYWDPLIMRDTKGLLLKRMEEAVDGEYQAFKSAGRGVRAQAFLRQVSGAAARWSRT